jgi:hypothetical protein
MSEESATLKERIERLRRIHLKALGAFNVFEQLQEYRAPNLLGKELAQKQAQAVGSYKGFFNIVENALNTELHITVAKLFDSHKDALHVEKLVNYAEQNQSIITSMQQESLDDDNEFSSELAKVYEGLNRNDLLRIKKLLDADKGKIERLKIIRDKKVAHEDIRGAAEIKYLTYQEFAELIELSETILNLVSKRIYGDIAWFEPYKGQVVEDAKSLLRLVGKSEGIFEKNDLL